MAGLADLLKGGMDDRGYGAGDDDAGGEPDYDASGKAAMKTFIAAVHARDAGGAWEALTTAYDLCEKSGGMGGEPDGDEGAPKGGGHALLLVPHGK